MNNPVGPTDNEFLNYLSWCEACDIDPFGEEQEDDNESENDDNIDNDK